MSGSTGHFSSSCEHMSTRKMIGTVLTISPLCHRTSVHTSTGCSPFLLMFGRKPSASYLGSQAAYNSNVYQDHIRDKIAELRDFVDTNLAQAATNQKVAYDSKTRVRTFTEGDPLWLSIPTAGKLDSRWEGNWTIKSIKSHVTMEISDGNRTRVVHVNRLQTASSQDLLLQQGDWRQTLPSLIGLHPRLTISSFPHIPMSHHIVDTHCGLELHLNGMDFEQTYVLCYRRGSIRDWLS